MDAAKESELSKTCPESILFIFYQILLGLNHLHSLKPLIIHGEELCTYPIQPANILLSGNSDFPHVVVGDLGVSVPKNEAARLPSCGSVAYHSPERIDQRFGTLDEKCDVWSAGVIFYQMITSQYPFGHDSHAKLRRNILEWEPPFHGSIWQEIDSIRTMSQSLLRKNSAERPTVREAVQHECFWLIGDIQGKHVRVIESDCKEKVLWETWDDAYTLGKWNTMLEDIEGTRAMYRKLYRDVQPNGEPLKFANGENQVSRQ
ncbi:kinase-like domain-containing protein [Syncephalastrum racemosum]|uniref:non-specific serine/threonine protein kinase n=1 Tax=Syncephalastrum racemosum TaxID=13706 RepID=A0A1X2HQD7_SYNRA|nr:kinase-like domain-containing protein [Syncephalastrum racemosum]